MAAPKRKSFDQGTMNQRRIFFVFMRFAVKMFFMINYQQTKHNLYNTHCKATHRSITMNTIFKT